MTGVSCRKRGKKLQREKRIFVTVSGGRALLLLTMRGRPGVTNIGGATTHCCVEKKGSCSPIERGKCCCCRWLLVFVLVYDGRKKKMMPDSGGAVCGCREVFYLFIFMFTFVFFPLCFLAPLFSSISLFAIFSFISLISPLFLSCSLFCSLFFAVLISMPNQ